MTGGIWAFFYMTYAECGNHWEGLKGAVYISGAHKAAADVHTRAFNAQTQKRTEKSSSRRVKN